MNMAAVNQTSIAISDDSGLSSDMAQSQARENENPPAYEAAASTSTLLVGDDEQDPLLDQKFEVPPEKLPSYEQATTLPSYEDFQQVKEAELRDEFINMIFPSTLDQDEIYVDGVAVGTDCMFILAFVISFFFNWLGFFIGYCILMNLAGRYGAISGFGLSIVQWLVCFRYASGPAHLTEMSGERLFMWWFFVIIATLLSMKGVVNWAKARKLLQMTEEQRENGRVMILY
ncbi:unnamed protein product [Clavelina lepadiformis]|uniref:Uncharacterized protein n=1 Tax=Clavelina lepadiformis TaxID=159417 RepID=A0ABP0H306_CLALP